MRPCKSRGEHICPAPRLTQILHKHQFCTRDKAQGRSPSRAAQCTLPSHLTSAPSAPFVIPHSQHFPKNADLQQLFTQGGLSQEGPCLLGGTDPSCAIVQKVFVLGLLFQKLLVHISRHEGTLNTGHTPSCECLWLQTQTSSPSTSSLLSSRFFLAQALPFQGKIIHVLFITLTGLAPAPMTLVLL